MSWKLPLNQVGSGCTFSVGKTLGTAKFRCTELVVEQQPWLAEILNEIQCQAGGPTADFSLMLDVEKQSQSYRVNARLKMNPKMECVRSLTPFRTEIETENQALFVQASKNATGGEHELSDSEMESYEHDGLGLVLSDFITDLVFTSLPDFPLCRPDCRGLCSECGCNLNEARTCARKENKSDDFDCPHIQFFQ
jgi:uncharacterized metal-binding protein YceD (DUF177 family)